MLIQQNYRAPTICSWLDEVSGVPWLSKTSLHSRSPGSSLGEASAFPGMGRWVSCQVNRGLSEAGQEKHGLAMVSEFSHHRARGRGGKLQAEMAGGRSPLSFLTSIYWTPYYVPCMTADPGESVVAVKWGRQVSKGHTFDNGQSVEIMEVDTIACLHFKNFTRKVMYIPAIETEKHWLASI